MPLATNLRPESRPTDWSALARSQRDCVRRLLGLLAAAAHSCNSEHQKDDSKRLPWLDRNRETRLAFLDGERGTGKSTVLTTLIRAVDIGEFENGATDGKTASEMAQALATLHKTVVWLEPIDIEPETTETSLLGAVVARIEKALETYAQMGASDAYDELSLLEADEPKDRALADFRLVQRKLALAWGQDGLPRGDSDALIVEIRRRELAKLGLHPELNRALTRLGRDVLRHTTKEPLFVLTVDDLDLNPMLCVKLLELLRAISVPRLFTIAIGSTEIMDLVMRLYYAARLKATGAELAWTAATAEEIQARSRHVALNNMRKLIPPHQRIRLEKVELDEALCFAPLDQSDAGVLADYLARTQLPIAHSLRPFVRLVAGQPHALSRVSLLDMLLASEKSREVGTGLSPREIAMKRLPNATFTGRYVLRTTPRRLADFWQLLRELADRSPAAEIDVDFASPERAKTQRYDPVRSELVEYLKRLAIEEPDIAREFAWKEAEESTGQPLAASGPKRPVLRPIITFEMRDTLEQGTVDYSLAASEGWKLETHGRAPVPLSPANIGALLAMNDVHASGQPDSPGVPYLEDDPSSPGRWAETIWLSAQESTGPVRLRWPAPCCSTFMQWDWFLAKWSEQVRNLKQSTGSALSALRIWLLLGTSILDGVYEPLDAGQEPSQSAELFAKGGRIERLLATPDDLQRVPSLPAATWLNAAVSLFLPEYGFPSLELSLSPRVQEIIHRHEEQLFVAHRARVLRIAKIAPAQARNIVTLVSEGPRADMLAGFAERWARQPMSAVLRRRSAGQIQPARQATPTPVPQKRETET